MQLTYIEIAIFIHLFLGFTTMVTGLFIYTKKDLTIWSTNKILYYLIPHLFTAITAFTLTPLLEFSPFKVLAIATFLAFFQCIHRLNQGDYVKAKYGMYGAYLGLWIAFFGTLAPSRILGYRLWIKIFGLNVPTAVNLWLLLLAAIVMFTIQQAIVKTIELKQSKI